MLEATDYQQYSFCPIRPDERWFMYLVGYSAAADVGAHVTQQLGNVSWAAYFQTA